METLILFTDTVALIVLLLFSMRNERQPDGESELGPFAILPPPKPPAEAPPAGKRQRRIRRL